jgi:Transcriptional regulator, AbiEi antitoxin
VLTRAQAHSCGLTDKAIEQRLRSGRWQRLHPGVYASFSGEPNRAALLWAAVLRAGPGAALSHQTAGELQGLLESGPSLIHVSVPSGSRVHSLLEFRYVDGVERAHGLPEGRRQRPVVRGGRRQYQDVEYERFGVVVELDGRAAHPEWTRWDDAHRDNANAAVGQITLRYSWTDVVERTCLAAYEVGRTLQQRGWDGALRRCGSACQLPF